VFEFFLDDFHKKVVYIKTHSIDLYVEHYIMKKTPKTIFLLSGKRKSGKDFVAQVLFNNIGKEKCHLVHVSAPLKKQYAKENGLDFEKLMSSGDYKEIHRKKMILWGEEVRSKDPGFFCSEATNSLTKDFWIVVDSRRPSDVKYFTEAYQKKVKLVRIQAPTCVRKSRGWVFTKGVDDAASECALDYLDNKQDVFHINNDGKNSLKPQIEQLLHQCV